MVAAVAVLCAVLLAVGGYLVMVLRQVRAMVRQLEGRLAGEHRAVITIDLVNRDLERLAAAADRSALAAETAGVHAQRDEQQFRRLITDISHDLRTPLTAVRGYQQLLDRSPLDDDQRAKLAVAQRHARELEQLVERLYEYTYLLDAAPQASPEELDLTVLLGEVLLAATRALEESALEVRFEPAGPVAVVTDREKLTRIVQNLVRNAAQHGRGVLELAAEPDEDGVLIRCVNGIDPDAALDPSRLFDRFYTADRSRSGRTTGLGLSIVDALTRQLGGAASATVDGDRLVLSVRLPRELAG